MINTRTSCDTWHDSKLGGKLTGVIDKTGDRSLDQRINDINMQQLLLELEAD